MSGTTYAGKERRTRHALRRVVEGSSSVFGEALRQQARADGIVLQCSQGGCELGGSYRYTWPGRSETAICEAHVHWLQQVSEAMGFALQVIPIGGDS